MADQAKALSVALLALALVSCGGAAPAGGDGSTGGDTTDGTSGDSADDSASETGTDTGGVPACPEVNVAEQPLRRITRAQYKNTLRDVLAIEIDVDALDADEKTGPFDANSSAPVSNVSVEQYRLLAEDIGTQAMVSSSNFLPCAATEENCDREFIREIGRLLYRRQLTNPEIAKYLGLFSRGTDFDNGVRLVLQAMLQSPNFLYHLEFGLPDPVDGNVVPLRGAELASRLSFFLWNAGPDAALLDAAEAGDLDSAEGLRAEAERLLSDTRAREAVGNFHLQWLALDKLPDLLKNTDMYPEFDESMREAMMEETRRFAQIVVLAGDGKLETLLTAPYSYLEGPLFDLYGVERPPGHHAGTQVELDPDARAGLLTQASFLATHAHANQSGPIQRGFAIRANFLCDPPPPPPPDVDAIPPVPDPNATTRELFEMHTAEPACASCHTLIDGIGLGFEGYDAIGGYRTTENGMTIDQSGELVGTDIDGEFDGVVELATKLSQSQQVRECVSRQWFRYAFGRIEGEDDGCSLDVLDQEFADSDYNIKDLLLALVQTDAFRHRVVD